MTTMTFLGTRLERPTRRTRQVLVERVKLRLRAGARVVGIEARFPSGKAPSGERVWKVDVVGSSLLFNDGKGQKEWKGDEGFSNCLRDMNVRGRLYIDSASSPGAKSQLSTRLKGDAQNEIEIVESADGAVVGAPPLSAPVDIRFFKGAAASKHTAVGSKVEIHGPSMEIGAILGDYSRVDSVHIHGRVWLFNTHPWRGDLSVKSTTTERFWWWDEGISMWQFQLKGGA